MAKSQDSGSNQSPDHIDQIRDIIFGPQKREYDQRFDMILAELRRLEKESREQAEEMRGSLESRITAGLGSLEKEIRQIASKLQLEASTLRNEIGQSEKKSESAVADARSNFKSELRLTAERLSQELEAGASAARERDVSKEGLAEILEELAMKLKGIDLLGELKKATVRKPEHRE
jgi:hypothetical protein